MENISENRIKLLNALRSNKYQKGIATSNKKTGKPIVIVEGYCACAVMIHELSPIKMNYREAREALGIKGKDCTYIQQKLNDSDLSFSEIADRIESDIFNRINNNKNASRKN